jgi:hypothetical protein
MSFTIRRYRQFPVQCSVTYNPGPLQERGTVCNPSCSDWRITGDVPTRPGETLSSTVTLPGERRMQASEAMVRLSRGQEFTVENVVVEQKTRARLEYSVKLLVQD